jgi:CRISPR/Cas system-associated exonuclease Cas4 (RecB family)
MTATLTPELPDIVGDIHKAIAADITSYPVRSNWCSKLGHPCDRHAVHNRQDWDKKEKHSTTTEMIFQGGKVLEKHVARVYLQKAGYDIVEEDRPVDTERSGTLRKLQISGKLDFVIRKTGTKTEYPVEVKSINQWDFDKINSVEDMTLSPKIWQRGYPAQLMLYLFGKDTETGLFLLINKATYEPKVIWTQLDYAYVENLLQKAERVNKHVADGTYPERIKYDDKICGHCEFAHVCLENYVRAEAQIITDQTVEDLLDEMEELKVRAKPMNDRIEEIKEMLKRKFDGVAKAIAGKWMVIGRMVSRKGFTVAEKEYWQPSYKKIGGGS